MRAYVTIAFGHYDLLSYFLQYYARIGVTEIVLLTYCEDESQKYVLMACNEFCEMYGVKLRLHFAYKPEEFAHGHRQRRVKEIHETHPPKYPWTVHADLDEFVELPKGVKTLQEVCENNKSGIVCGVWLDRIASNSQCVRVNPLVNLELQYPNAGRFRARMGYNQDVVVAANFAPLSHHPRGSTHWREGTKLNVHHFKWQENAIERMNIRSKSQFVRGKHLERVKRVATLLERGIPRAWHKHVGSVLGI